MAPPHAAQPAAHAAWHVAYAIGPALPTVNMRANSTMKIVCRNISQWLPAQARKRRSQIWRQLWACWVSGRTSNSACCRVTTVTEDPRREEWNSSHMTRKSSPDAAVPSCQDKTLFSWFVFVASIYSISRDS